MNLSSSKPPKNEQQYDYIKGDKEERILNIMTEPIRTEKGRVLSGCGVCYIL